MSAPDQPSARPSLVSVLLSWSNVRPVWAGATLRRLDHAAGGSFWARLPDGTLTSDPRLILEAMGAGLVASDDLASEIREALLVEGRPGVQHWLSSMRGAAEGSDEFAEWKAMAAGHVATHVARALRAGSLRRIPGAEHG